MIPSYNTSLPFPELRRPWHTATPNLTLALNRLREMWQPLELSLGRVQNFMVGRNLYTTSHLEELSAPPLSNWPYGWDLCVDASTIPSVASASQEMRADLLHASWFAHLAHVTDTIRWTLRFLDTDNIPAAAATARTGVEMATRAFDATRVLEQGLHDENLNQMATQWFIAQDGQPPKEVIPDSITERVTRLCETLPNDDGVHSDAWAWLMSLKNQNGLYGHLCDLTHPRPEGLRTALRHGRFCGATRSGCPRDSDIQPIPLIESAMHVTVFGISDARRNISLLLSEDYPATYLSLRLSQPRVDPRDVEQVQNDDHFTQPPGRISGVQARHAQKALDAPGLEDGLVFTASVLAGLIEGLENAATRGDGLDSVGVDQLRCRADFMWKLLEGTGLALAENSAAVAGSIARFFLEHCASLHALTTSASTFGELTDQLAALDTAPNEKTAKGEAIKLGKATRSMLEARSSEHWIPESSRKMISNSLNALVHPDLLGRKVFWRIYQAGETNDKRKVAVVLPANPGPPDGIPITPWESDSEQKEVLDPWASSIAAMTVPEQSIQEIAIACRIR